VTASATPSATVPVATDTPEPTATTAPPTSTPPVVPPLPSPPPAGRPAWTPGQLLIPLLRGDTSAAIVYLTFDDGWGYVDDVRAVLQQKQAAATACLVGQYIEGHAEAVRRWSDAGLTFCNHSYSHTDLTKSALLFSPAGALSTAYELTATEAALQRAVPGATMAPFFRPPFGAENQTLRGVAASLGYRTILWSLDTRDWAGERGSSELRDYVVNNARPGDVILMHFTRWTTVEALPGIIDGLRARGFTIAGLESLPSDR
jgi:peptidoglycan/xylan/chitin deacetylase (PgdA/CDA1 family)